ncbi:class I SAM-dependent methyltransferase [Scytonema sp. UIC 10036]|uniref:class I SAM-dependent methyltransferase n=1 Tax=Scytonema sp. UIC 10036 TaxID=2304196 RepID=UPI0012DA2CD2|nr:class I SAM-dependent methyltransferase [Scytonema sp. UIC 10036]MUG91817.1 class I SAM-dependent methyltransferase [Scytonema sp. UIC 10036]
MSQIITELTGVPSTMLLTLRGRADEQLHPHPLFQDPLAVEWSKLLPWDNGLEAIYSKSKLNQISFAVRAYHHDQIASRHIANHSNPVVVELGAGLSTRFHRIGEKSYRWLELDLPVVTELRHKLDTQTQQHQFISASVMDFDWMSAVPDVAPENILFIAEGLLPYFKVNEVQHLVSQMRSRFSGASLVLDILGNYAKVGSKVFSQIGASHQWYVKNEQEVTAMGLHLVNVWSLYQLYPERWPWLVRLVLKLLTQLSYFRNAYLILETKL